MKKHSILKKYLGEIVYGGNDGIITTFAVVSGFSGAALMNDNTLNLSIGLVILFGFANLFSDGLSMGIGNYLSKKSVGDGNSLKAINSSLATFLSFLIFGALPLIPYIFEVQEIRLAFILSVFTTFLALFLLGFFKALIANKKILSSVIETILIGGIAALVAFLVGVLFKPEA